MNGKQNWRKIQRTWIIIMIHGVCNPVSFNFHITQFLCECWNIRFLLLLLLFHFDLFCYSAGFICTIVKRFISFSHLLDFSIGTFFIICNISKDWMVFATLSFSVCALFFFIRFTIRSEIQRKKPWKFQQEQPGSKVYRFAANKILLDACISESMCFVGVSICIIVFIYLPFFSPFSCWLLLLILLSCSFLFAICFNIPIISLRLYVRFLFILAFRDGNKKKKNNSEILILCCCFHIEFRFPFFVFFFSSLLISLFLLCYSLRFLDSLVLCLSTSNFQHIIIIIPRQLSVVYIRLSLVDLVRSFGDLKRKLKWAEKKHVFMFRSICIPIWDPMSDGAYHWIIRIRFGICTWHNILFQFC